MRRSPARPALGGVSADVASGNAVVVDAGGTTESSIRRFARLTNGQATARISRACPRAYRR